MRQAEGGRILKRDSVEPNGNSIRRSVARRPWIPAGPIAAPHPPASGERAAAGGQDKEDQEIPSSLGTKVGRLA